MSLVIYEFDAVAPAGPECIDGDSVHAVPGSVFAWLEIQCLRSADRSEKPWLRITQRCGRRVIQVTGFVGVIRAPNGYQIEVLPKIGRALIGTDVEARRLLLEMLCCLREFRHIKTDTAKLLSANIPLLEIFIAAFLNSVEHVVKRGLRSDYLQRRDNVFALRGKLLVSQNIQNLSRPDRFFVEYDEFLPDRLENRLLRSAIQRVLMLSSQQANQKAARELKFVFADIPPSTNPVMDFRQIRVSRDMAHYAEALSWAKLILNEESPLTGSGASSAPSLLFPMEAVFEAFVAKHVERQLAPSLVLKSQTHSHYLVRHRDQNWFRLIPDLLVRDAGTNLMVLDTKWKLLDSGKANASDKYGLSQGDFYQLQAYGHSFLDGKGDVALVYPKTGTFGGPLPAFHFQKTDGLRLWVLPFCLKERRLLIPPEAPFASAFRLH